MTMSTGGTTGLSEDPRSLRDVVYQQLRDEILNGRISPRERLTEPKLGKLFDVSRTPVREALSRLLSDGLVERTDFGYAVVVPSLEDLRNLYELRITLELRGIARAIENPQVRHDEELLRTEREKWAELRDAPPEPDASFVLFDEGFHQVLSRSSGNTQLTGALVTVNQKIRAVRMHDFVETDRITATIDEHLEILDPGARPRAAVGPDRAAQARGGVARGRHGARDPVDDPHGARRLTRLSNCSPSPQRPHICGRRDARSCGRLRCRASGRPQTRSSSDARMCGRCGGPAGTSALRSSGRSITRTCGRPGGGGCAGAGVTHRLREGAGRETRPP